MVATVPALPAAGRSAGRAARQALAGLLRRDVEVAAQAARRVVFDVGMNEAGLGAPAGSAFLGPLLARAVLDLAVSSAYRQVHRRPVAHPSRCGFDRGCLHPAGQCALTAARYSSASCSDQFTFSRCAAWFRMARKQPSPKSVAPSCAETHEDCDRSSPGTRRRGTCSFASAAARESRARPNAATARRRVGNAVRAALAGQEVGNPLVSDGARPPLAACRVSADSPRAAQVAPARPARAWGWVGVRAPAFRIAGVVRCGAVPFLVWLAAKATGQGADWP